MTKSETSPERALRDLTDEERRQVGGGLNPQPLPPRAPDFH